MIGNTLDLDGSRDHIARLVREYEAALKDGNGSEILEKRERMGRWLWPLARWYLDHSESKNDEDEDTGGEDLPSVKAVEDAIAHVYRVFQKHFSGV